MKKYIKVDGDKVTYTHFMPFDPVSGLGKTEEELLKDGILVDEIPDPLNKEGFISVLRYSPEKGLYYTFESPETSGLNLDEYKALLIEKTNEKLQKYLADHPLVSSCHANKEGTYSITEDKMNMFTSNLAAHQVFTQIGIPDEFRWNETGKVCEAWTDDEAVKLLTEWKPITVALVEHQQFLEVKIRQCATKEEAVAIALDIEYDSADPRNKI